MIKIKKSGILTSTIVVALSGLLSANLLAQNSASVEIGFGSAIDDLAVAETIDTNRLSPRAAYMWTTGLTATHRTIVQMDGESFVRQSRNKLTEMLEESLKGNVFRLKSFIEENPEEKTVISDDLQSKARSLLNIHEQLRIALDDLNSSRPIIYAIHVEGNQLDVDNVRSNRLTEIVVPRGSSLISSNNGNPSSLKPDRYKYEYLDEVVQRLKPEDLHQRILEKIAENQD